MLKVSSWQLGGVSSMLAGEMPPTIPVVSNVPTLIIGMDVSHGSPGQSDIPSIAAVKFLRSHVFKYLYSPSRIAYI